MVYYPLSFTWDIQKSEANLERRGFDFAFATLVFDGHVDQRNDARRDYGERRVVAVGVAHGWYLTVIYTDRMGDRGVIRRIISARRSNRRERRHYDETFNTEA